MLRWITGGSDTIRVSHSDERAVHLVARCHRAEFGENLVLCLAWTEVERLTEADFLRDRRIDEVVERTESDHFHHLLYIRGARADVPRHERLGRSESAAHFQCG
jgi:hypothetical protein